MSVLGCSRRSNRRPAASGLPRPADIFSFFLAPYEAIDLGAADRPAQDQRVGDPADGVGMIEQQPARLGRNDFPG
jgi:hypothetical protein